MGIKGVLNQGLVIINLHMKFNVHSSKVKQVIVLQVRADRAHNDNLHFVLYSWSSKYHFAVFGLLKYY